MGLFDDEPSRRRLGASEKQALYKIQDGKCMYCGKKMALAYMHIDHKTPIEKRGSNRFSNLQFLCSPCNTRKGKLTDGQFRKRFELTPSREAKGPPRKVIPLSHFERISKERAKEKRNSGGGWGIF